MSFAIPDPFVWDESFRVDYEVLDHEHKNLFRAIFDLTNSNDAKHLANLLIVTAHHFGDEEGQMRQKRYGVKGEYDGHKKAHDEFLDKLGGLRAPVDAGSVNFAKNWLVNHIKGTDFKYKGKL